MTQNRSSEKPAGCCETRTGKSFVLTIECELHCLDDAQPLDSASRALGSMLYRLIGGDSAGMGTLNRLLHKLRLRVERFDIVAGVVAE